uniref:Cytidyltransferase-like domain-containing protein n=1 Tax=Heterosigma akashiwo TaxID=2829 RepID=A0A6V2T1S6_HETAK|mmetsp:Transcript_36113/g.62993  ORF Transcript_36113/g.62993 Transcript_36113/m.62993 type:complete len:342 (+) Transcript_36113:53-1078(+)|eukprot:CAMPEP_0206380412 /NCGR_PEP_ID=MMETSP0294-20121207/12007_1 /ASSEMBLY_ACC=CAM_ASM_000327 /TAXON_ID=39354 /ORGANISM="Heterosigma akashiwo, Strain CCMP2393" /LENGTH=341 /DNA_ID=CAMNT_0053829613 /DNA_START=69 /DNA_END=1094 /DNA_ORIENTATION=+
MAIIMDKNHRCNTDGGDTFGKLRAQLISASLGDQSADRKPYAALLTTGSLNPIHKMHVEMLEIARRHLSQYFKVVGGFISPSHDSYVKSKMRSVAGTQKWCIPHREKLCKLALMDSDWISADLWEFNCSSFVDFFSVFQQLQNSLNESINVPVQLLYVCGEDHFVNCGLYSNSCEMPVIGIGRPGKVRLAKLKRWTDKPEKLQFFAVGKLEDVSSTHIRKCLMKGHQLNNQLVSEAVSAFLLHSSELSKWRERVGIKSADCAVEGAQSSCKSGGQQLELAPMQKMRKIEAEVTAMEKGPSDVPDEGRNKVVSKLCAHVLSRFFRFLRRDPEGGGEDNTKDV